MDKIFKCESKELNSVPTGGLSEQKGVYEEEKELIDCVAWDLGSRALSGDNPGSEGDKRKDVKAVYKIP
jgi:hypothetical protein